MTKCFWNKCTCPETSPNAACSEHEGIKCSLFNGTLVANEADIQDSVTTKIQAEMLVLGQDRETLIRRRDSLRQRVAQMERERDEFEDQANLPSGGNIPSRRRVFARARVLEQQYIKERERIRKELDAIDVLMQRPEPALELATSKLKIPYRDPGYCACHKEKTDRLDRLSTQISTERANLAARNATYRNLSRWKFSVQVLSLGWTGFSLLLVGGAILFGSLGWAALILPFIGFMIAISMYARVAANLANAGARILTTKRRLLTLVLSYYRIQQVSVCRRPTDEDPADSGFEVPDPEPETGYREPTFPPLHPIPLE